jgi:ribonuclease VapC
MVIDTSVVIAILAGEPEEDGFYRKIKSAPRLYMSVVNLVEAAAVLMHRGSGDIEYQLDAFLARACVEIVPADETQAHVARDAYRRFGKGRHPAKLNIGDCFAYALAIRTGDPLLFKGNDFGQTDVLVA